MISAVAVYLTAVEKLSLLPDVWAFQHEVCGMKLFVLKSHDGESDVDGWRSVLT